MLSNNDIIDICQKYNIPLVGVFSKDCMPKFIEPGGYIINLENQKDENGEYNDGSHWVAIYIEENKKTHRYHCCYFDSFGCGAPQEIAIFIDPLIPYRFNYTQIQSINSGVCGYYCIYFIYWMATHKINPLHKRFKIFTELWDENVNKNRELLQMYLFQIKKI